MNSPGYEPGLSTAARDKQGQTGVTGTGAEQGQTGVTGTGAEQRLTGETWGLGLNKD